MADSPSVIGVGWAGTILSILLYASQLPLMRRLIREGDATLPGYSFLPVLGQIAQAGPWCGYAICVQPTIALLVANFAGVGFASLYLLIFAIFTPTWLGRLRIAASGIAVGGVIVAFYALLFSPLTGPDNATAVRVAGIATVVVNQAFWVVPFLGLWRAYRTLDTARTSLLLSALQLVALSVWAAYGVVLDDVYVQGNCFTASCLGFLQCCAILWIWHLQRLQQQQQQQHGKGAAAAEEAPGPGSAGSGGGDGGAQSAADEQAPLAAESVSVRVSDGSGDGSDGVSAAAGTPDVPPKQAAVAAPST